MKTATLAQAKRDFENRLYVGAAVTIHDAPDLADMRYTVEFAHDTASNTELTQLVDARTKAPRLFRTLDAAHKVVRDIGFLSARVFVPVA